MSNEYEIAQAEELDRLRGLLDAALARVRVLEAECRAWRNPDHEAEPFDMSDAAMRYAEDAREIAHNELVMARAATDAANALGDGGGA